jgi:tRNA uracil 4-sulfurtransferase
MSDATRNVIALRWGEIFLKGQNRPFFERKLVDNVRRAVAGVEGARIEKLHGRILVDVPEPSTAKAVARLARVFGLTSLSPARVVAKDLEAIAVEAIEQARQAVARRGGKPTFKVETRRPDKRFALASPEVSAQVGARIIDALGLPVDVHRPQLTVGIEIGTARTFVWADTVPGPGGLPVGVTGRVNLLLSGGIDSPVAGWLAMKRGCSLVATYFHSFPYTGDKTKEKVIDLCRLLVPWQGEIKLMVVPFTDVQKKLRDAGPGELAVVLYRRMMMRVATLLAERERALAIVTGENLAQVASQTLENLGVIEEAAGVPVLRPLLTNDKLETVALAKAIGTFETSILPYEDCCSLFVPEHPATRAHLEVVQRVEDRVDPAAMAATLAASVETIRVA